MLVTKRLLRGAEVAAILNVSTEQAYRWMRKGVLPTIRQGRLVRVPASELEKWISENTRHSRT